MQDRHKVGVMREMSTSDWSRIWSIYDSSSSSQISSSARVCGMRVTFLKKKKNLSSSRREGIVLITVTVVGLVAVVLGAGTRVKMEALVAVAVNSISSSSCIRDQQSLVLDHNLLLALQHRHVSLQRM